ncbi:hypothetical protein M378DRAFT_27777 [Amanita muscaria Koide BX008]|uniref:Uncharacterized protein n=1 Tax=Amanita muscaria (strain Koide BX008) TaxID=946122 RepID=A0A0C2S5H3_AMAMK|nr:hypothetical protein M378DRAFT_27777 [Amanita muscaria Koide BX008]
MSVQNVQMQSRVQYLGHVIIVSWRRTRAPALHANVSGLELGTTTNVTRNAASTPASTPPPSARAPYILCSMSPRTHTPPLQSPGTPTLAHAAPVLVSHPPPPISHAHSLQAV